MRFSKFEAVIALTLIVTVSFLAALFSENKAVKTSAEKTSVALPIIMYHNITADNTKVNKYTVSVEAFRSDLEYINENGYNSITVSELYNYVNGKSELPEKPIMITFDDGFESFYTIAYPLLRQYKMKAVVSVIGSVTEKYSAIDDHNISYSNLTWSEINEMAESGLVEFQNHSYDMHSVENNQRKGICRLPTESEAEYKEALTADLLKAQQLFKSNCGFKPVAVAYPYGAKSKITLDIIKSCGFICSLGCEEKSNNITVGDRDCLFDLGRYNRDGFCETEVFFNKI